MYLNNAFSAPSICTVDAGYLAKFVKEPACDIKRAPTCIRETRIINKCNLHVHVQKQIRLL